tara:strand:- start:2665 stop:3657 length:993 start_codon:yes stop_codon:yes gene_type:complete
MKQIFLITGCAGFIGSHMVDYILKKGHKVIGIDNLTSGKKINIIHNLKNKNFRFYKLDLKNIERLKRLKKIDYVIHLAGYGELIPSIERPLDYFYNNAYNTAKLTDYIRKKKFKLKKFIYAASSSCYGISNYKTSESTKIKIEHPYAFTKFVGEQVCLHWGKVYKIPTISIRIFNAYGPRSRTTNVYGAVIGVFLKQRIAKKPLTIIGKGDQKRDFLFISDLCDAFYKAAMSNFKNEIFNLGNGLPRKINDLAKLIYEDYINIPWRPGEPKITHADISKIKNKLNWKPKISLETGIARVLKDLSYWKKAPLWTEKKIEKATKNWMQLLKN